MRIRFSEVFTPNPDGSFTPNSPVRIGGVTLEPGGTFSPGVPFSGVDLSRYAWHDLDVDLEADGTVVIKAVLEN